MSNMKETFRGYNRHSLTRDSQVLYLARLVERLVWFTVFGHWRLVRPYRDQRLWLWHHYGTKVW